jgi:hypothetical protein
MTKESRTAEEIAEELAGRAVAPPELLGTARYFL